MNMRKISAIGVIALVGFGLAGCSASQYPAKAETRTTETGTTAVEAQEANSHYASVTVKESTHTLSNGKTVTCLVYAGVRAGGLSCDWTNAK